MKCLTRLKRNFRLRIVYPNQLITTHTQKKPTRKKVDSSNSRFQWLQPLSEFVYSLSSPFAMSLLDVLYLRTSLPSPYRVPDKREKFNLVDWTSELLYKNEFGSERYKKKKTEHTTHDRKKLFPGFKNVSVGNFSECSLLCCKNIYSLFSSSSLFVWFVNFICFAFRIVRFFVLASNFFFIQNICTFEYIARDLRIEIGLTAQNYSQLTFRWGLK